MTALEWLNANTGVLVAMFLLVEVTLIVRTLIVVRRVEGYVLAVADEMPDAIVGSLLKQTVGGFGALAMQGMNYLAKKKAEEVAAQNAAAKPADAAPASPAAETKVTT